MAMGAMMAKAMMKEMMPVVKGDNGEGDVPVIAGLIVRPGESRL
jgi:hypothetical protein